MLRTCYCSFDKDGSGTLDRSEFKKFLDELRTVLNLTPVDNYIFNKVMKVVDANGDGQIDADEFMTFVPEVLPILLEPGVEFTNLLKKVYNDFDINRNNALERKECKILFDLSCDKIGVHRCTDWELDYIISQVSERGDIGMSQAEFISGYWMVLQQLQKNKKTTKKERYERGGDYFRNELHKMFQTTDPDKALFYAYLGEECKVHQKRARKADLQKKMFEDASKGSGTVKYKQLDIVNSFGKDNAKTLVSLEN
jgi:hypothetical protein